MQPFEHAWQLLKTYSPFPHLYQGTENYFPRAHRDLSRKLPPPRGGQFYQKEPRPTPPPENSATRPENMPASSEEYMEEFKRRYGE